MFLAGEMSASRRQQRPARYSIRALPKVERPDVSRWSRTFARACGLAKGRRSGAGMHEAGARARSFIGSIWLQPKASTISRPDQHDRLAADRACPSIAASLPAGSPNRRAGCCQWSSRSAPVKYARDRAAVIPATCHDQSSASMAQAHGALVGSPLTDLIHELPEVARAGDPTRRWRSRPDHAAQDAAHGSGADAGRMAPPWPSPATDGSRSPREPEKDSRRTVRTSRQLERLLQRLAW